MSDSSAAQGGSGGGAGGSMAAAGTTTTVVDPPLCVSKEPTAAPRLLLNDQQLSHVAAIFDESVPPSASPPLSRLYYEEPPVATEAFVERQQELATRIAQRAVSDSALFTRVVGCDFEASGADACLPYLIELVLTRLYRGLAADDKSEELRAVYESVEKLNPGGTSGLRAVLEAAFQAPELWYRVEVGRPSNHPAGWAEPTPREMASRLSFLLWDRGPDDELLAAADAEQLRTPEQLAAQARRLLRDPRARDVVRRFYEELLSVGRASDLRAPALPPDIYAAMRGEFGAFVEEATFGSAGDLAALFAPTTWVTASLAQFYGFPPVAGGLQRVELDRARYGGIVTQGAWLAGIGVGYPSPTQRGMILTRALLCREVPPEPPGLGIRLPVPSPSPTPLTMRQRLAEHAANPTCQGCHQLMDPYGLALEHFDHFGRWRDTEEGLPIDTAVQLYEGDNIDGSGELAAWFLAQPTTRDCFVQNWRRFAFGRQRASAEDCEQQELLQLFRDANESVVELLVGLTQTNNFRYLGK